MFTYPVYKEIKDRLKHIAPVFRFHGQYNKGKDNISYKVPAIYIELPNNIQVQYNRKRKVGRGVIIKLHYISSAPYKHHDNDAMDNAYIEHESELKTIDKLMDGWEIKTEEGKLITEQFTQVNEVLISQVGENTVSVFSYKTDVYSDHLTDPD